VSFVSAALMFAGCRQDMHDQPKYVPLRQSAFFNDERSARPLVEGTVARGQLHEDELMYTGKVKGEDATLFPMRVDAAVMARGQQRFNIYCSPCHGRTGQGDGMIVRRGYRRPPSMHQDRLRNAPVGHFFDARNFFVEAHGDARVAQVVGKSFDHFSIGEFEQPGPLFHQDHADAQCGEHLRISTRDYV
jgi:hypothetical protein